MTEVYKFKIKSAAGSPIMFGRPYDEKKLADETHDQFEERCWTQKVAKDKSGQCFVTGFALKNALESAASRLQIKVPSSKGTFTKLFRQGVRCFGPFPLAKRDGKPLTIKDVDPIKLFVPADGKRGSAKRVMRVFPTANNWEAEVEVHVVDKRITEEVLRRHIEEVGQYIGFGSMRVENGGINGMFEVIA